MQKHAYLILAHNNFYILEKLLELLDDERNDIYIHIDKKVKSFKSEYLKNKIKKSNIVFIKRINIEWGKYSLIQAELNLFKKASEKKYQYYHLLSGTDLPLKNQDYIHKFFNLNEGKEFIICSTENRLKNLNIKERFLFYYLKNNRFLNLQKKLKIYRNKADFNYNFGSNWVSLTHDAVKYILSKENWINKVFKYSVCCDEVYKQSILINSIFNNNFYKQFTKKDTISFNMRYIKWDKDTSHPYIFRESDFSDLIQSHCLFARKFDYNTDKNIIDKIYNYVKENKL